MVASAAINSHLNLMGFNRIFVPIYTIFRHETLYNFHFQEAGMCLQSLLVSSDLCQIMHGINECKKTLATLKIAAMNSIVICDANVKNVYLVNKSATKGTHTVTDDYPRFLSTCWF